MPLPVYQQSGLLSQPTQKLDFADLRESERTSQMIGQSLDRLSEFAFKVAAKTAAREGEQWAYNNPISDEQIMAAKQGSLDIAIQAPKAGTIFGDAARKIQAGQLRSTLELAARSEIASIYKQVEAGQITNIRQLDDQFYGIAKGNGNVIAKLDPEQANAFRASVATASNVVYQAAAKRIGEFNAKVIEENVNRSLSDFDSQVRASIDKETDPKKLNDLIFIERNKRLDLIAQTYDPIAFANTQKNLDTRTEKAYVDRLSNYFSSDEFGQSTPENSLASRMQAIQEGNTAKYQDLWKTLPTETRDKVIDQFYNSESKKEKFRQDDFSRKEKLNKEEAMLARDDFYTGKITGDDLVNILLSTGQASSAEIKAIRNGQDKSPANFEFMFSLEQRIALNKIGENELRQFAKDGKISWEEAHTLGKQIRSQDKDLSMAKNIIDNGLGISDPFQAGMDDAKRKSAALKNQITFEYLEARKKGEPFDVTTRAQQLVSAGQSDQKLKNIDEEYKALKTVFGKMKNGVAPPEKGKFFTPEEIKRKNKEYEFSDEDMNKLMKAQERMREAMK
jgi:hypothetical protein